MSRGTIGITAALLLTEYHQKIGTFVEGGDLGFRCPVCSQPVKAVGPGSEGGRGRFRHFSYLPTCPRAEGESLPYAWLSDVLARYLTPQVRAALAKELIPQAYQEPDPDGPIYIGGTAASMRDSEARRPRRHLHARTS
jgi:hypothetical protein